MSNTNFCSINCAQGATDLNMLTMGACFLEGYLTSTIEVDKFDDWASCRTKRTSTCESVDHALNGIFVGGIRDSIDGFKELAGLGPVFKDTMGTCTAAWKS